MIVLASKSPRRQELLKYITTDFEIKTADVDEALPNGITPSDAVLYLSKIKAEPFKNENDIVIGADTVVAIDDKILGKPTDKSDAKAMLRSLSGKYHSVFTGVSLIKGEKVDSFFVETRVKFFDLTDEEDKPISIDVLFDFMLKNEKIIISETNKSKTGLSSSLTIPSLISPKYPT